VLWLILWLIPCFSALHMWGDSLLSETDATIGTMTSESDHLLNPGLVAPQVI
jgi:hypothetical protein